MLSDLLLVAAVLGACVFAARGTRWAAAIECAFPLLAAIALFVTDERTRFLAFGIVVAVAFAGAALVARQSWTLVIAGVALLRWIPLRDVEVGRELVVLAGALALYFSECGGEAAAFKAALPRRTPTLIACLAVAVVTPTHPGKAALFPLALAVICGGARFIWRAHEGRLKPAATRVALAAACAIAIPFARWSLVPMLVAAAFALLAPFVDKLKPLVYAGALALFALWPWSGVVARALPVVTRFEPAAGEVRVVGWGLARGESMTLGIPRARHVTVNASAANATGMPPGRVVGFIDAGGCTRAVRIGDVADFGFTRREHFFAARNPLPRATRADIRGYGSTAWLHGAGAIGVACRGAFASLRFRGADDLPPGARLQIESVEVAVEWARDPSPSSGLGMTRRSARDPSPSSRLGMTRKE